MLFELLNVRSDVSLYLGSELLLNTIHFVVNYSKMVFK